MSEPLVIVGNGMAAARFCEELVDRACGRYAIAVIGEEPRLAYNRVLLSSLLADEVSAADVELKPARWWRDRGVTVLYGQPATAIDPAIRRVRLANGASIPYSKLVIATGSRPIRLTAPGMDLRGVKVFRDFADVAELRRAAKGARAVVIGGGLLGLEAAYGLAKGGAKVTLVHLMDRLMERQLDARAAQMLAREVEARGVSVLLGAETTKVEGHRRVEGVRLADGRVIEADLSGRGGRRSSERRARAHRRHRRQSRDRCRRRLANQHRRHSRHRRMRRASRPMLRPGRAGA